MKIINPEKIKRAGLIVGIPSYNEAETIGFVVKQIDAGLKKYFPKIKSVIINVDNNSPDGTKEAFFKEIIQSPRIYISTPPGVKGKGNNFYNLFKTVVAMKAKTVIVVDADLKSITPEWIKNLAEPIMNGYDFALPIYSRNKYDATITNHICRPLVYALLGKKIYQPIGGDFSFSSKINKYWLGKKWRKSTKYFGIDIFMTLGAILGKFKACQVKLGAKIHKPSAPNLGPMFSQVAETLFEELINNKNQWKKGEKIEQLLVFSEKKMKKPQRLSVDYEAVKNMAMSLYKANYLGLKKGLMPETYNKVVQIFTKGKLEMDQELWIQSVYDLLYSYDIATKANKPRLIEALKCLYWARIYFYSKKIKNFDSKRAEKEVQKQAQYFLKNKDYLLKKYL